MNAILNWLKQCVDFDWSPVQLTGWLNAFGLTLPASEWQKKVANGTSRGLPVLFGTGSGGAEASVRTRTPSIRSPLLGLNHLAFVPTACAVAGSLPSFHG